MVVAAALSLCLLTGCDEKTTEAAAAPPPAVSVQAATTKGVAWEFQFVGRIKAIEQVETRARVEGFLAKVLFREGQDVKAGDILYQIEKDQYQALVEQAQADLVAAQAVVVNAQLKYDRSFGLRKTDSVPQSSVDQNKADLDSAKAGVLQKEAILKQAQINLSYTDIASPIDGRIGRTTYTQGNLVNAASGVLATIVSQDPIYVLFPVGVRQLEEIRKNRALPDGGQAKIEIMVQLPNGDEYPHRGIWNYTDPQVDQQTDTINMRATLPNPDRQLVDGEFVTVSLRARQPEPQLVVPQAALQTDQAGYYVMVVGSDNKVEQRRVQTGQTQGTDVVVNSGIKDGENIIVEGVQKVRPGQTVTATTLAPEQGA